MRWAASLLLLSLASLQPLTDGGAASAAPAAPGRAVDDWAQQRDWLLERNRILRERLDLSRRCLVAADSRLALERCRLTDPGPSALPMGGMHGGAGFWPGCPMW